MIFCFCSLNNLKGGFKDEEDQEFFDRETKMVYSAEVENNGTGFCFICLFICLDYCDVDYMDKISDRDCHSSAVCHV